ncbi:MAG: hypothetical protein NTU63_02495 [Candidatus Pacearchaeota archaeon]|nr:hypothetical protein [Candidatus Pacearchaeota archaeon]
MTENLEEKAKNRVIILGLRTELEEIENNPLKFIEEKDAEIIYCRTMDSFTKAVLEKMPVSVYYTGKIRQCYDANGMEYWMTINNPRRIRKYIKSKGIKKIIKIDIQETI